MTNKTTKAVVQTTPVVKADQAVVKTEQNPDKSALLSIKRIYFDDTWIKAFGRGYSGPCSWCK